MLNPGSNFLVRLSGKSLQDNSLLLNRAGEAVHGHLTAEPERTHDTEPFKEGPVFSYVLSAIMAN